MWVVDEKALLDSIEAGKGRGGENLDPERFCPTGFVWVRFTRVKAPDLLTPRPSRVFSLDGFNFQTSSYVTLSSTRPARTEIKKRINLLCFQFHFYDIQSSLLRQE